MLFRGCVILRKFKWRQKCLQRISWSCQSPPPMSWTKPNCTDRIGGGRRIDFCSTIGQKPTDSSWHWKSSFQEIIGVHEFRILMANVHREPDTLFPVSWQSHYLNLFKCINSDYEGPHTGQPALGGLVGGVGQWHGVGLIPAEMLGKSVCLLTCGFTQTQKACLGNSSVQI